MTNSDNLGDPALDAPFAALRGALQAVDTPDAVEKQLLTTFDRQFPPRRWYHALSLRQWGVAGGVGSTALAAVLALMLSLQAPPPADNLASAAFDDDHEFIALESAERIEQEPDARVVQANVPRAALASLGVPVTPQNAGEPVRAEMLVGADGAPLALRLVSLP